MTLALHHPFGGEAAVLYLEIMEQIERQQKHLTVADVFAVISFIKAESEVQLSWDVLRRIHANEEEQKK